MPVEGFDQNGVGDGELRCEHGHVIRKGALVFWKLSNWEYGEYTAHCTKHARAEANQRYGEDGYPLAPSAQQERVTE